MRNNPGAWVCVVRCALRLVAMDRQGPASWASPRSGLPRAFWPWVGDEWQPTVPDKAELPQPKQLIPFWVRQAMQG